MEQIRRKPAFLNFDGSYLPQKHLLAEPHLWLDFSDLAQSGMFCAPETGRLIQQRLRQDEDWSVCFIGGGNYHYVTLFLLEKIKDPFSLVLFDNHSDANDTGDCLSCGSWVAEAILRLDELKQVLLIGADPQRLDLIRPRLLSKLVFLSEESLQKTTFPEIAAGITTDLIYISIDKDVLDPGYAVTQWDQGRMSLPELLARLQALLRLKTVAGLDVCGEYPASPVELFQDAVQQAIRKNEYANEQILNLVTVMRREARDVRCEA